MSKIVIGQNDRLKSYVHWREVGGGGVSKGWKPQQCTLTVTNTARTRKSSIYGKLSIKARKTFIQKVKTLELHQHKPIQTYLLTSTMKITMAIKGQSLC